MSVTVDYPLGTIVDVSVGRGVIRFSGATSFKPGKWVGIELYEPNGKNNGTVDDVSYFTCKMNYGVFVRASQIKATHGSERVEPAPGPSRPPVRGHQRTSSSGLLRANSLRTGSPLTASPRSESPAKPTSSPVPSSRLNRGGQSSPTKTQPRVTLKRQSISAKKSPESASSASPPDSLHSPSNGIPAKRVGSPLVPPSPSPQPLHPPTSFVSPQTTKPPSRPPSSLNTRPPDDQELQELRAKVRVLEAKRADDARHVRELETRLSEAESFVSLRPKLQAKLTSQQTELIATKRELADAQQLAELTEIRVLDAQEQLEMAFLDKEVAEERAEMAEAELEEAKEKLAEATVELDVWRQEDGDESDAPAGARSAKDTLAFIQLEKQNERLKEALLRLRDMSQENELEQRRRISEMEKDMTGIDDLQTQYDSAVIKLANAEIQIEDLKLQLDDALGAEDMLVQLTERNLMLGEKIEEMRITIEDLEALKELNDELEENHVETEKALLEDLEMRDTQIRDQARKIENLEETCLDLEGTIEQFRDLVMRLQQELTELRTQTQTAQDESATAASQSAAMMSLTMKLQSSAAKNQSRQIEHELIKLEAKECRELLNIVQPYLPQLYVDTDSDATSCYMFFQRLAYKTDVINTISAEMHGLPKSVTGPGSETLVGATEMRGRLSGLSTLCKRFAAILRRCDVESFLNIGRIYQEIAPMEKRIDMHLDLLRRDEFRDSECVNDIVRLQAQFDHLAETYFDGFESDIGERELGYVVAFDRDLDMFAAAIGFVKTSVENAIQDDEAVVDMGGMSIDSELFQPLQALQDQCQNAKALSKKLTKRLEDLTQDSAALKPHLLPQVKAFGDIAQDLVNFAISFAQQVMPYLSDVRAAKTSFQLNSVLSFVRQVAASTVGVNATPGTTHWEAISESINHAITEGGKLLPVSMESENVLKITGIAPWVMRVAEVKASTTVNLEAERKSAQKDEEIQGLVRMLKVKEQVHEEDTVKIALLERRNETNKKNAETIADLEVQISKCRKQERVYEEAMEQLQTDLDALEQDNAKLKTLTAGQEKQATAQPMEVENVPIEGSLETSHLLDQIDALRGTVRYFRTENSYLKSHDLLREIEALPPLPQPRVKTPALVPSGTSDSSDDSDSDGPSTPPTLRSLATETKMLYRDVIHFSSSPRVVDLSALNAKRMEANGTGMWMPKKKMPAHQVRERKLEAERLQRRVKGLMDRATAVGAI
ncbi:dynactin [Mycena floridula]|nr:dynactin [Mycena floridula]